jgi:hypothetical protein
VFRDPLELFRGLASAQRLGCIYVSEHLYKAIIKGRYIGEGRLGYGLGILYRTIPL